MGEATVRVLQHVAALVGSFGLGLGVSARGGSSDLWVSDKAFTEQQSYTWQPTDYNVRPGGWRGGFVRSVRWFGWKGGSGVELLGESGGREVPHAGSQWLNTVFFWW